MSQVTNSDLLQQFVSKFALTVPQQLDLLADYIDIVRFAPDLTFALYLERKAQRFDAPTALEVLNFYMPTKGDTAFTPTERVAALDLYVTYMGLETPGAPLVPLADILVEDLKANGKPVPEPKAKKTRTKKADKPPKADAPPPEPAAPEVPHGTQALPPDQIHVTISFTASERGQVLTWLQLDAPVALDLAEVLITKKMPLPGVGTVHASVVNGQPQPYLDIFVLGEQGDLIAESPPISKHTHFVNGEFQLPKAVTVHGVNIGFNWGD